MDEHLYNSAQKDEKMVTVVFKYNEWKMLGHLLFLV